MVDVSVVIGQFCLGTAFIPNFSLVHSYHRQLWEANLRLLVGYSCMEAFSQLFHLLSDAPEPRDLDLAVLLVVGKQICKQGEQRVTLSLS